MDMMTYLLAKKYVDKVTVDTVKGKSAYEIAVENGFEGTEKEWLESLVGPTPDLTGYFNETNLIALTKEEILEICK